MTAKSDLPQRLNCNFCAGDPEWEKIEPIFLKETVTGAAPRQATTIKTAWSSSELHVLFRASDTEAWATMTERDGPLYEEEVVELFLDPVEDLEGYFEIEVNPLNTVCDLVLRRTRSGYRKCFAWNCDGLRTRVEVQPDHWQVELALPFVSLATDRPKPGSEWRVNFCRIDRPRDAERELSAWSPTGRPLFHVSQRFGVLEFVR